jgi:hypothetical protein
MLVLDRQQVLRLPLEPLRTRQCLALGTVAMATGVVGDALVTAVEAMLDVAAERRGPAVGQIAQGAPLHAGQVATVVRQLGSAIFSDHISHFQRWPHRGWGGHGCPSGLSRVGATAMGADDCGWRSRRSLPLWPTQAAQRSLWAQRADRADSRFDAGGAC